MSFESPTTKRASSGSTPKLLSPLSKSTTDFLIRYTKGNEENSPHTNEVLKDMSRLIEQYQQKPETSQASINFLESKTMSPIKTPLIKITRKGRGMFCILNPCTTYLYPQGVILSSGKKFNEFHNSPYPYKTPTRSIDLVMITPTSCTSGSQSSVLIPMQLTYKTPIRQPLFLPSTKKSCTKALSVRKGKRKESVESTNLLYLSEDEDLCTELIPLSESILQLLSSSQSESTAWMKEIRVALRMDQIKLLLERDIEKEELEKTLNYNIAKGNIEQIDRFGEKHYRIVRNVISVL